MNLVLRSRSVRALSLALGVMAAAMPAAGQSASPETRAAVDVSTIRIDNFGQIDQRYYRGAQPQGADYANLAALGVRTLVDLTGDDGDAAERTLAAGAGLKYVHIPMTTHTSPTSAQLAQFLEVVNDPAAQPVYVHCVGGRHRTGVMTAIYRMTHDGWTADRAFSEMKRYKFGADMLHAEFKQFVYGYKAAPAAAAAAETATTRTR
jgi:protein tyrosine/serine phosphatase